MAELDLNTIRAWRPETIIASADQLAQKATAFLAILDEVKDRTNRAAGSSYGSGEEARYAHVDTTVSYGYAQHELMVQHHQLATECGYALKAKRDAVLEEVQAAQRAGLIVRTEGVVEGDYPRQAELMDKYAESVGRAKHDLEQADADFARRIRDLNAKIKEGVGGFREAKNFETFGNVKDEPVDPDKAAKDRAQHIADGDEPLPTDPKALNDLFKHIHADKDPELLKALQHRYPDIGNKPGFPFEDRDVCNRQHMGDMKTQAQAELDALRKQHPDWDTGHPPGTPTDPHLPPGLRDEANKTGQMNNPEWGPWSQRVQQLQHQLEGYNNLQGVLDRSNKDGLPRFLGFIDDKGHAAVSIGNPDTAKKVDTFVPGTGQDMVAIGASDDKSTGLHDAARQADKSLGKNDVSVTTWMGYDRPMTVNPYDKDHTEWAGDPQFALNGAQALDDWQNALRFSHDDAEGRAYQTVIGHSYGSSEVGAAATHGHRLDADALVFVGSPGVFADNAHGLYINPGGRVFDELADNDIIHVANAGDSMGIHPLGVDPSTFDDVTQVKTDPGPAGDDFHTGYTTKAHSSYFFPDSSGLQNLGKIIAGVEPEHK
ncbi:MAG: alpha/beta hydrolase [Segniliparus sp.]|uniref:alpha/beta hydrolase n=1 Tax=Segniliparus sp. TaxID=2804064 RepID=UPI003F3E961A